MNLPQRQHEFLLTPNANLHMRPLTYCLLSTLLFGLPFSAFMSMLISYRRLWAVLSVVVISLDLPCQHYYSHFKRQKRDFAKPL